MVSSEEPGVKEFWTENYLHLTLYSWLPNGRSGGAAAALVFFAAAAWAGIVAAGLASRCFRIRGAHEFHQFFRRLAGFDQLGKFLEVGFAVGEKRFQSGAEIVKAGLSVRRRYDSVFGAAAVAHTQHFTFTAVLGQTGPLILAELPLSFVLDHFGQRALVDVADLVFRQHVVVA